MADRQTERVSYIEMPLTRACIEKWTTGRTSHGPEFIGRPVPDAFEECLDGINYLDEAELQGIVDERLITAKNHLMLAAERIREYWLNPHPAEQQGKTATVRSIRRQAAYELRNDLLEDEMGQAWSALDALLKATADGATPDELAEARKYAEMVQEDCAGPAEEPEVFNG
jgi:hypothetical protein